MRSARAAVGSLMAAEGSKEGTKRGHRGRSRQRRDSAGGASRCIPRGQTRTFCLRVPSRCRTVREPSTAARSSQGQGTVRRQPQGWADSFALGSANSRTAGSDRKRILRLRIPVAVLAFSLQMSTFEGAKRGFGGRFGGRLQEDPPPGTAENGSNLGPIVDRVRAVWRR